MKVHPNPPVHTWPVTKIDRRALKPIHLEKFVLQDNTSLPNDRQKLSTHKAKPIGRFEKGSLIDFFV